MGALAVVKMPPQLVLLPGLDGTGDLFQRFLDELPTGYQCQVDRYPSNLSSYADLDPIVRCALPEIPPYVLVAESFSSPLAIRIASTHPGYFQGLILCGGFATSPVRDPMRTAISLAAPWLFRWELRDWAARRFLVGSDTPGDLIHQVRNAVRQVGPQVLADRLRALLRCDVQSEINKIWVPILCLRGSADRLVGENCAREIISQAKREESRSATIDGPHMLMQARPSACVDAIADFLRHSC